MKKVTRWSPDTCGCIIDYDYDDVKEEFTLNQIIKRCLEHERLGLSGNRLYDEVRSENTRKNLSWKILHEEVPSTELENYVWEFDSDRALRVSLLGIAPSIAQRNKIQADFNAAFGLNKARMV